MFELQKEVDVHLRSRHTLVCLVSHEEERILAELQTLCEKTKRTLLVWDHADYFRSLANGPKTLATAKDPLSALDAIEKMKKDVIVVLRDFHQCWRNQPRVVRKLRNLAESFKYTKKSILITSPSSEVPDELEDSAVILEVPLPDYDGLVRHDEETSRSAAIEGRPRSRPSAAAHPLGTRPDVEPGPTGILKSARERRRAERGRHRAHPSRKTPDHPALRRPRAL